jgi:hypothetical protein
MLRFRDVRLMDYRGFMELQCPGHLGETINDQYAPQVGANANRNSTSQHSGSE